MLTLLIWLLILILVMGVLVWVIQQLPLPAPFGPIAIAIIGLVFILIVVSALLGEIPLRPLSIR
jgi:hypothetical protein